MFSFWPGFPGIVRYGHWSFLGIALSFALLLDAFLIANFYWTRAVSPFQRNILLGGLLFAWIVLSTLSSIRRKHFDAMSTVEGKDESYREAIVHYLRGNWFEAESLIVPHLQKHPRDLETLLLQATLYRHTKRFNEAKAVLETLCRYDGSNRWYLEIETEKRLIHEAMTTSRDL